MFQNVPVAKLLSVSLLALLSYAPSVQSQLVMSCPGGNCPRLQQCQHRALIPLVASPVVHAAPQLFRSADEFGDPWVYVEEPVYTGEPEDIVSPIANQSDTDQVKAEVEDDAAEEANPETADTAQATDPAEDQPAQTQANADRAPTATRRATKTRGVWMRAGEARAAGLLPISTASNGGGAGSQGSATVLAPSVACRTVTTYQTSYGSSGTGYSAFYGQPVYYQSANACGYGACAAGGYYQAATPTYYRTRRVWFPNLFPRLRGLR